MILFWLLGAAPILLIATLVGALWLTVVELLEFRPHWTRWLWWLGLVFLTHFFGYLVLRGYTHGRRKRAKGSRA